jgi:DNA-binding CsgD family transcriptional regulator
MLGIAQAPLDSSGRPLAPLTGEETTPLAARLRRLAGALQVPCNAVANSPGETRVVAGADPAGAVLLRAAPRPPAGAIRPAQAVALTRADSREDIAEGARILAEIHGLSRREALLAEHLSRGVPLVEAGRAAGLSAQTARTYSKQIYARTGTAGQADLVRLVLTGLTPLA